MRLPIKSILIPLFLFPVLVQAECKQPDRDTVDQVQNLVNSIESNQRTVKSVDDFLSKLPREVRQNMIFMSESRSLQEGSKDSPRVILKSRDGGVTLSFNTKPAAAGSTDPDPKGFDSVEVSTFDPTDGSFKLTELRFPDDSRDPQISARSNASVERNPAKCVSCHMDPSRPVWDSYRFWAGMVPFSEDTLRRGSLETEQYRKYLADIQRRNPQSPRLRHLQPLDRIQDIDRDIQDKGYYQLKASNAEVTFNSTPSPGLNLSHQYLEKNGCRIGHELAKRSDIERIKYALIGSLENCSNIQDFRDDAGNLAAAKYFVQKGIAGVGGAFSYPLLEDDTKSRQSAVVKDKEGRESWILEKNAPGATAADRKAAAQAELAAARTVAVVSGQPGGYGLLDFDNNPNSQSDRISKIRYLLEPLGVEVNKWSMGADPEGYTFAEFFSRVGRSQPLQDLRDSLRQQAGTQDFCTFLADRSKTALAQAPYRALVGPACEPPSILDERAILAIQGSNLGLLRKDVKDRGIFAKCTACHLGTFPGAPSLPFGNPAQLEQLLKDTGNGPGGWADRIWSRVSRSPEAVGAMPMGGVALPSDDKVALRAYLRAAGTAP